MAGGQFEAVGPKEDEARVMALVAWRFARATIAAEALWAQHGGGIAGARRHGNGGSVFAYGSLPVWRYHLAAVARVDRADLDGAVTIRAIGGIGVAFHREVRLFLDYQRLEREDGATHAALFHWDIRF